LLYYYGHLLRLRLDNCVTCWMCVVDNFKQFLSKVPMYPGNFSYSDGTVLDLVKFAELRVSDCKGKGKRMTKGQKHLSVMQVVPWVSIVTCKVKN